MENVEVVEELEKVLAQVNAKLRELLPKVSDPGMKSAIVEIERMSRWNRAPYDPSWGSDKALEYCIARARKKAAEYGEPTVVFKVLDGDKIVISTRKRFEQDRPFGATDKDILFATDQERAVR